MEGKGKMEKNRGEIEREKKKEEGEEGKVAGRPADSLSGRRL